MALASQEGWLRLWGDWLKMGVHVHACVYAYACVCVHGHVFVWLCFGAESPAKLGKSSLLLTARAHSTSFFSFFPPGCLHQIITALLQTWTSMAGC